MNSMGGNEHAHHRHLFTVRLWRYEPSAGRSRWLGQVLYAGDGDRRAFHDWPEMVSFIEAKLKDLDEES